MRIFTARVVVTVSALVLMTGEAACSARHQAVTNCGSSMLQAKAEGRSTDLLSCAAAAGVNPLPEVTVRRGETITIDTHGGKTPDLTSRPDNIVMISGTRIRSTQFGQAIIDISGWPCTFRATPPASCPLLHVIVSG
jgi:hypothetical protein